MHGLSYAYKNHLSCLPSLSHTHTNTYTQNHSRNPNFPYFPNPPALHRFLSLYLHVANAYLPLKVHFKWCPSTSFTKSLLSLNPNTPVLSYRHVT